MQCRTVHIAEQRLSLKDRIAECTVTPSLSNTIQLTAKEISSFVCHCRGRSASRLSNEIRCHNGNKWHNVFSFVIRISQTFRSLTVTMMLKLSSISTNPKNENGSLFYAFRFQKSPFCLLKSRLKTERQLTHRFETKVFDSKGFEDAELNGSKSISDSNAFNGK